MESLSTVIFLHEGFPLSSWTMTWAAATQHDLWYDLPRLTAAVWSAFSRSHQGESTRKPPFPGGGDFFLRERSKRRGQFAHWSVTYPADAGDARQNAFVLCASITGRLSEEEVNLVVVRVVGVCDGMGSNKLALCGDAREKSWLALIYKGY